MVTPLLVRVPVADLSDWAGVPLSLSAPCTSLLKPHALPKRTLSPGRGGRETGSVESYVLFFLFD